jgi:hypothetical protein
VPPEVTVGEEELRVGAWDEDGDEVPVLPVVPVLSEPEVSAELPDNEPPPDAELDPDDEDVDVDVAVPPDALAPGRSWATAIPMATVAPVAATTAPRVRVRRRLLARSLSAGVFGWPWTDIRWRSLVGGSPTPPRSN